jgi:hypothetical protein
MSSDNGNSKEQPIQSRAKFAIQMKCGCGQVGSAVWEENAGLSPPGPRRILVQVSSGFYMRVQKKDIGKNDIVCSICDSVVRD